ncbi:MAG: hypothetical protein ACRC0X_02160 [Brevinema sp.]
MSTKEFIINIRLHNPVDNQHIDHPLTVEDVISFSYSESATHMVSSVELQVPFTVAFLFHNDIAYQYIEIYKIFSDGREENIFWGKVDMINAHSDKGSLETTVSCSSFTDTYVHAQVDNQSYNQLYLSDILKRNIYLICNDTRHGSVVSFMERNDVVFVPKKNSEYDPLLPVFTRNVGQSVADVINALLSRGALYLFTTMYKGRPKIIINNIPLLPSGINGFEKDAHLFGVRENGEQQILVGKYGLDNVHYWNVDNIISCDFSTDYTRFRDRIRILTDNNDEYYSSNPETKTVGIDRISTNKKELKQVPFVPIVIIRENMSKSECKKIANHLWNNINMKNTKFTISIAGWELFGEELTIGKIINFQFSAVSRYRNDEIVEYILQGNNEHVERMIIVNVKKSFSLNNGITATFVLMHESGFYNEVPRSKPSVKNKKSYYNAYEGS